MSNKKILIALGSPRADGNTATLAKWVGDGARAAGAEVELVDVGRLSNLPGGCASCYGCQPNKFKCALKDETAALINRLSEFDAVVLATPIYFFNFSAQIKRFIDRFMALGGADENGRPVSMLQKIQLAVVATSEGDAATSGLEVIKCNMRYLSDYTQMPEVRFFHHGCCSGAGELGGDAVLKNQAEYFGRELAR